MKRAGRATRRTRNCSPRARHWTRQSWTLQYTRIVAPNDGLVTDLRVDVGNFAATGQPLMTFVAVHQIWVEANLTENNLGHIKPGDPVDLVLDVWPDQVLRGRVRNITYGVTAAESTSKPGGLPTVQNTRDWLRNAQRFPVLIDFENPEEATQLGGRVGSQVNVTVYTGDHPILNAMGRFVTQLSRLFSYAY
jgi:multidrug resistance efflux pump